MVPAWCLRTTLLHWFVFGTRHRSLRSFVPFPLELAYLGLCLVLGVALVLVLSRSGRARSESWWLAGGLFVVAAAVPSLVIDIPEVGDGVFIDLLLSLVSGDWIAVFAVGALTWWHWMPTYPPTSWASAPVLGSIYDDDADDETRDDER